MIELSHLHPHGVFLRKEALAHGYEDRDLTRAMRSGLIARIRHGAYVAGSTWSAADATQRHVLRCHAVLETHGRDVALSHTSAAAVHGIDVWPPELLDRVHLTRLGGRSTRSCHDVVYHRGTVHEGDIVQVDHGGRATSPPRAVLEHASIATIESGVVSLDSYLHHFGIATSAEVERAYRGRAGWPGNRHLRMSIHLARPGAESVGESRMRFLFWEFHLPEPELQVPVYDDRGRMVGRSDFRWQAGRVLGEFDGRAKYTALLRPGESTADAVLREKQREDRMREITGFRMIRFTWADLYDRERTAARVRRALGIT